MLKRGVLFFWLSVVLAILLSVQITQNVQARELATTNTQFLRKIERFVDKLAAEDNFSGAILIARGSTPILKKAYGLASKDYNIPNRVDTKFNLGSMNKMFTAVAIAQLAEQEKLSFNDTVGKHLPNYPNKQVSQKVTIHQLLTHTSGLGNYFNDKFFHSSRENFREVRDYFPLFVNDPLQFEPGSRWSYSNEGFIVLGALVQQVSGENYFDYIRKHIYQPAGMSHSDSYELDYVIPNLAIGYTRSKSGQWQNNVFKHVIKGNPAGGGYSTVEDLLRFATALKEHKLLNLKYTEIVLTGKVDAPDYSKNKAKYAYGFADECVDGQYRVGHAGEFPGINSQLSIYPELGYIVVVMSNYDPPIAEQVSDEIAKMFRSR